MFNASRVLIAGGIVAAIAAAAPQDPAEAQQVATYVCQTPRFWCAFQWMPGYPDGTPCYCLTYMGAVSGYSINPSGVQNAPPLPAPQTPNPGGGGNPVPPSEPKIDGDDCYNGLGNCPGSFRDAATRQRGQETSAPSTGGRDNELQAAISRVIAEAPDFDRIAGELLRSSSYATRYRGTVPIPGFSACTVVESDDGDRRYECVAPSTSFSAMAARFAEAYGAHSDEADETNFRFRSWLVDDIEITVWVDDEGGSYVAIERYDG